MAVTYSDIIQPEGEIDLALFPSDDDVTLRDKIEGWIAQGYSRAAAVPITDASTIENIARAWAYHRAYGAAALSLAARPSSLSVADGSVSWSSGQLAFLQKKAEEYRLAAEALMVVVVSSTTLATPSGRAATVFTW